MGSDNTNSPLRIAVNKFDTELRQVRNGLAFPEPKFKSSSTMDIFDADITQDLSNHNLRNPDVVRQSLQFKV